MENDEAIVDALRSGLLRYEAETGNVYSIKSNTPMKPIGAVTRKGYLRTCITRKGSQIAVMVHRVACIAAHGVPKSGQFVNHKNGIKTDNSPGNLEWVTNHENIIHASVSGLLRPPKQERHYASKLSAEQVLLIRASEERTVILSARYGISASHVRRIKTSKRWTDSVQVWRRTGNLLDGVRHEMRPGDKW